MRNLVGIFFRLVICTFFPAIAFAMPGEEQVISGNADFAQVGEGSLEITTSDKAIINYESFNIAENERVRFIQPGSKSCVLNRITGEDPSSALLHKYPESSLEGVKRKKDCD